MKHIKIVELMADYNLGYNSLFFGQFSLIQDHIKHWKMINIGRKEIPIKFYFIGSNVSGKNAIKIKNPITNKEAYLKPILDLCKEQEPVFVVSHFIHKEAPSLLCLNKVKLKYKNFFLIIILHCTQNEFLMPWLKKNQIQDKRLEESFFRSLEFRNSVYRLSKQNISDKFIAVSKKTKESYLHDPNNKLIQEGKIIEIFNGVSEKHYTIIKKKKISEYRRNLRIEEGTFIGCTIRWTHTKGKDILEAFLDLLEQSIQNHKFHFFFPVIIHDQVFELIKKIPEKYPLLYQNNRIHGFLDISRIVNSVFPVDLEQIKKNYQDELQKYSESFIQIFNKIFIGFIKFPIYQILDIYIRPSIAEAFGLGTVESYLCGVPVIASDRGGCRTLVDSKYQIHLNQNIKIKNIIKEFRTENYFFHIKQAAIQLLNLVYQLEKNKLDKKKLRNRMIRSGYTTNDMLKQYSKLFVKLMKNRGILNDL
ncbi:glycosyltransferase [Candidatus Harpocratesius sp.]